VSRISVIIPTYNRKDLLRYTLENVMQQSKPADEVIVVDDHSSDGTLDFVRNEYGGRVQCVENKGKGPGAARSTGLQLATGDYIKFLDSDDFMTKNMLETQARILDESGRGFTYSATFQAQEISLKKWKQHDPTILFYSPVPPQFSIRHHMIRGLFINHQTILFRRDLLAKVGLWRQGLTVYEDWDYLWRVSGYEPSPIHSNECAFLYRLHGKQSTGANMNDSQRDRDMIEVYMGVLDQLRGNNSFTWIDILIFETYIAYVLKKNASAPWVREVPFNSDRWIFTVPRLLYRISHKWGRIKTGTMWQPRYGPVVDPEKIRSYLKMIDPGYELIDSEG
jgi:glycosyltransferase involved in cell wall biosynthesis